MNNYKEITEWLDKNNRTRDEMDEMWSKMYEHNWKIKQLTDIGKSWYDLNLIAVQSLIFEYNKVFNVKTNTFDELKEF